MTVIFEGKAAGGVREVAGLLEPARGVPESAWRMRADAGEAAATIAATMAVADAATKAGAAVRLQTDAPGTGRAAFALWGATGGGALRRLRRALQAWRAGASVRRAMTVPLSGGGAVLVLPFEKGTSTAFAADAARAAAAIGDIVAREWAAIEGELRAKGAWTTIVELPAWEGGVAPDAGEMHEIPAAPADILVPGVAHLPPEARFADRAPRGALVIARACVALASAEDPEAFAREAVGAAITELREGSPAVRDSCPAAWGWMIDPLSRADIAIYARDADAVARAAAWLEANRDPFARLLASRAAAPDGALIAAVDTADASLVDDPEAVFATMATIDPAAATRPPRPSMVRDLDSPVVERMREMASDGPGKGSRVN